MASILAPISDLQVQPFPSPVVENKRSASLLNLPEPFKVGRGLSRDSKCINDLVKEAPDGAMILLAGPPGSRKSGLALQFALDLGKAHRRSLYLMTEEPGWRLRERAIKMTGDWNGATIRRALGNVQVEDSLRDVSRLPDFVQRRVIDPAGEYHGTELLVLDSIQGTAMGDSNRAYRAAIQAAQLLQSAGITTLLIGHVTKQDRQIRGPCGLEHAVDTVLLMGRGFGLHGRSLLVPKNRFGPAVLRPIPLQIDPVTTRLERSRIGVQVVSLLGIELSGALVEVQVAASPAIDVTRGHLRSCGSLERSRVTHAITCLEQNPIFAELLEQMNLSIHCRIPSGIAPLRRNGDQSALDLSLGLAIAGACLGRDVPAQHVAVGEVDLRGAVRDLPPCLLQEIGALLRSGDLNGFHLLVPRSALGQLPWNAGARLLGCETFNQALEHLWPGQAIGSRVGA